jgi:GDP-L-fucose synthase
MMDKNSKIYIAGHKGLVGSALLRKLEQDGYENVIYASHDEVDLRFDDEVDDFFATHHPEYVFFAAAKVGGIFSNQKYPADFININLAIQSAVINACHKFGVKKLLFFGSVCSYPKNIGRPILESDLWNGPVEPTSQWYATAKLAGIKMCQAFHQQYKNNYIVAIPCNLYGINDNFCHLDGHVIPSLIRSFHYSAQNNIDELKIFGTGTPQREFLYCDDLADAAIFLMNNYDDESPINIGGYDEVSIKELAAMIAEVTNYKGTYSWDHTHPDGNLRRKLDSTKITNLGWIPKTPLKDGIQKTYEWFLSSGL